MAKPLTAEPGREIDLIYKVTDDDGRVLDQTLTDAPMTCVVGGGLLLPEVEDRIVGMKPGERASFRLEPPPDPEDRGVGKKGYLKVPRAMLPSGVTPQVGMALRAQGEAGEVTTWIREVRADVLVLDTRHPLYGLALNVEVEVLAVRRTKDEA